MAKDIQKKSEQDLLKELREKREALRGFRFDVAGSKPRNVKEGQVLRKEIARILTELNARAKSNAIT